MRKSRHCDPSRTLAGPASTLKAADRQPARRKPACPLPGLGDRAETDWFARVLMSNGVGMTELNIARLSCGEIENIVCELWRGYFGRDVSRYDDFYDLGGDSLALIDVVARARERGLRVRSSMALRCSTPARLAEHLTIHADDIAPVRIPALENAQEPTGTADIRSAPIGSAGGAPPLYVVHSDSHVQAEQDAIEAWQSERLVRCFRLTGARGRVSDIADRYLAAMDQSSGPYRLAGFGSGAVVAYEMARRLRDRDAEVALLALIKPPVADLPDDRDQLLARRMTMLARRFGLSGAETVEEIHTRMRADGWYEDVRPDDLPDLQRVWVDTTFAVRAPGLAGYDGPAVLFQDLVASDATELTWRHAVKSLETHWFDHGIESPQAILRDRRLAECMRRALVA